jgi:hypothetical protein
MTKFLIGMATAALWFVLSHAANAECICRQASHHASCVSSCDAPTGDAVIRR